MVLAFGGWLLARSVPVVAAAPSRPHPGMALAPGLAGLAAYLYRAVPGVPGLYADAGALFACGSGVRAAAHPTDIWRWACPSHPSLSASSPGGSALRSEPQR